MKHLLLILLLTSPLIAQDFYQPGNTFYGANGTNYAIQGNTLTDTKGNQFNNSNNNYGVQENTFQINRVESGESLRRNEVMRYGR